MSNSRRRFLGQMSLGGAAPMLSQPVVHAAAAARKELRLQTRALEVGQKFGIGIIGCGARSRAHVLAIADVPEMEVRALCDILPEAMQTRAKDIKGTAPAMYPDYRELLADPR